jgi:hypothetical protein
MLGVGVGHHRHHRRVAHVNHRIALRIHVCCARFHELGGDIVIRIQCRRHRSSGRRRGGGGPANSKVCVWRRRYVRRTVVCRRFSWYCMCWYGYCSCRMQQRSSGSRRSSSRWRRMCNCGRRRRRKGRGGRRRRGSNREGFSVTNAFVLAATHTQRRRQGFHVHHQRVYQQRRVCLYVFRGPFDNGAVGRRRGGNRPRSSRGGSRRIHTCRHTAPAAVGSMCRCAMTCRICFIAGLGGMAGRRKQGRRGRTPPPLSSFVVVVQGQHGRDTSSILQTCVRKYCKIKHTRNELIV